MLIYFADCLSLRRESSRPAGHCAYGSMKRSIWILVILVAIMGGLDALQPFMAGREHPIAAIGFAEEAELLGYIAVVVIVGVTLFLRHRRSKK